MRKDKTGQVMLYSRDEHEIAASCFALFRDDLQCIAQAVGDRSDQRFLAAISSASSPRVRHAAREVVRYVATVGRSEFPWPDEADPLRLLQLLLAQLSIFYDIRNVRAHQAKARVKRGPPKGLVRQRTPSKLASGRPPKYGELDDSELSAVVRSAREEGRKVGEAVRDFAAVFLRRTLGKQPSQREIDACAKTLARRERKQRRI